MVITHSKLHKNPSATFWDILTTDRQTHASKNKHPLTSLAEVTKLVLICTCQYQGTCYLIQHILCTKETYRYPCSAIQHIEGVLMPCYCFNIQKRVHFDFWVRSCKHFHTGIRLLHGTLSRLLSLTDQSDCYQVVWEQAQYLSLVGLNIFYSWQNMTKDWAEQKSYV